MKVYAIPLKTPPKLQKKSPNNKMFIGGNSKNNHTETRTNAHHCAANARLKIAVIRTVFLYFKDEEPFKATDDSFSFLHIIR